MSSASTVPTIPCHCAGHRRRLPSDKNLLQSLGASSWDGTSGRWLNSLALAIIVIAMAVAPAPAQTPRDKPPAPAASTQRTSQGPSDPNIRVTVERVQVPFTVVDDKDRFVTDLTQKDFVVYEDGQRVPIDFFTSVTRLPLRVGLLLDTSNSVRLQFKGEQEAAIDFVHNLLGERTRHKLFLMTFDTGKDVLKEFTDDPNELSEAVRKLKVGGGTALYDAIHFACREKLMKQTHPGGLRRVLMLISDGEDSASRYTLEQVVDIARRGEVSIYSISTNVYGSSSPGDGILQKLAEETGGMVVYPWKKPPSAEFGTGYLSRTQIGDQNAVYEVGTGKYAGEAAANLALALLQIKKELESQYNIGYRPPNRIADGKFREIKVVVQEKGLKVRARKGYYFPSPL